MVGVGERKKRSQNKFTAPTGQFQPKCIGTVVCVYFLKDLFSRGGRESGEKGGS